jgi:leucyl-tRNA synthetase
LYDIGAVSTNEPFARLEFLGFILAEDGRKMSKRWGNIINPDDVVSEYGADTLRVYEMFMAPFEQTASWSTSSIKGSDKFLDRVYALKGKIGATTSVEVELHKTIKKVGEDIENFKFNTAVSSMMILVNSMESGSFTKADYCSLLKLLAPFAPHITEQVWHELGNETFIHKEMWPTYDEYKLVEGTVTLAIQIAGKMRGTIEIARDSEDSLVVEAVKNHEMYKKYVGENEPKKVIIVKNKIVNIVL